MKPRHQTSFHVALTADFYDESGQAKFADFGLNVFDRQPHVAVSNFAAKHQAVIDPAQLAGVHRVVVLTPQVVADSIAGLVRRTGSPGVPLILLRA